MILNIDIEMLLGTWYPLLLDSRRAENRRKWRLENAVNIRLERLVCEEIKTVSVVLNIVEILFSMNQYSLITIMYVRLIDLWFKFLSAARRDVFAFRVGTFLSDR